MHSYHIRHRYQAYFQINRINREYLITQTNVILVHRCIILISMTLSLSSAAVSCLYVERFEAIRGGTLLLSRLFL